MRTELETRYTLLERDANGDVKKRKSITESKYTSLCEEAKEQNEAEPEAEKVQTFKRYNVESLEDFNSLVPDKEEQLNIINRTLDIKQTDAMRSLMESIAFATVEGSYDLGDACAQKTERKAMTDLDKAAKVLGKLSSDDQAKLLELLAQRLQPA